MNKRFVVLAAVSLAVIGNLPSSIVWAAPAPTASPSANGQGIQVSPPVVELKGDPGKTVTTNISVTNVTDQTMVLSLNVNDFEADKSEAGTPHIIVDPREKSPYSLRDYIQPLQDFQLGPREQEAVKITLNIPKNASPGGHYGVVRFTAAPPGFEGTGVSLSASVGTLILLNVSGDVKEGLEMADMYVTDKEGKRGWFFQNGPVTIVERIRNTGNVHEKPTGVLVVRNAFGKQIASLQANEGAHNILPGSVRKFEQTLKDKPLFGWYTAQLHLGYNGQVFSSKTITFWVLPLRLAAIVLLVLFLLIVGGYFGIKRYNRYIVRRSRR